MGVDNSIVVVEREKSRSYTVAPDLTFFSFLFLSSELVGETVIRILGSHPRNYIYMYIFF